MDTVFLNGTLLPRFEAQLAPENRAFRYGDGCFEAIRITDGKPVFWDFHFDRFSSTLMLLQIEYTFDQNTLLRQVKQLLEANAVAFGGMLRIMAFRQDGGTYFPASNQVVLFMEVKPMEHNTYEPCEKGRNGVVFTDLALPSHSLGNHKTLNKTIHISAAVQCQKLGVDDAIVLNDHGQMCEAISSNIFLVMKDCICTPPLTSGCLNGTVRKVIQANSTVLPLPLVERDLLPSDLDQALEVWTTNAGSAIRWFERIENRTYQGEMAQATQRKMSELAISSVRGFQETQP